MDEEDVVHMYKYIYIYSVINNNKIMPFVATWMDPDVITLSEIRKRKTNTI